MRTPIAITIRGMACGAAAFGLIGCASTSIPSRPVVPISGWRATSTESSPARSSAVDTEPQRHAAADAPAAPAVNIPKTLAQAPSLTEAPKATSDVAPTALPSLRDPATYVIDLPSVMAMTNASHPLVAVMRWRVEEAEAQSQRAEMLWLPSLRAGLNFHRHEGRIQDVAGNIINTSRGSFYGGLGAQAVGAGSPAVPGLYASFHLTDVLHQPEIADQEKCARQYAVTAAEHDAWLHASQAYVELVRAHQERAIAADVVAKLEELERITGDYARTGQGPNSDHERAQTELALRRNDVLRASEAVHVASARLAQHVRLDPTTEFAPSESAMLPLQLSAADQSPQQLVADALSLRPEAAESRHLVSQAVTRWQREKSAPWLPSVLLGASYGGLTGGLGGDFRNAGNRFDSDVAAYWEVRQLGLGEKAARTEANSRIEQAKWREISTLDRIAREVVEATAQVNSRRQQIALAETAVAAAQRSYEQNRERVRNAQGLPIEALQAIQALGQARREYLRCVADYNSAQLAQQRALGWPIGQPQ